MAQRITLNLDGLHVYLCDISYCLGWNNDIIRRLYHKYKKQISDDKTILQGFIMRIYNITVHDSENAINAFISTRCFNILEDNIRQACRNRFYSLCRVFKVEPHHLLSYAKSHNFDITDETTDDKIIGKCAWKLKSESGECY